MDDHLVANVASPERAVEKSAASDILSDAVRCKVPLQVSETKAPHKKGASSWAAGLGAIAASSATADAPLVMKRGPRGCRRSRLKPVDSAWHFTGLWSVAANAKATKNNCCGVGDVSGGLRCRGHCRDRPFGSPECLGQTPRGSQPRGVSFPLARRRLASGAANPWLALRFVRIARPAPCVGDISNDCGDLQGETVLCG